MQLALHLTERNDSFQKGKEGESGSELLYGANSAFRTAIRCLKRMSETGSQLDIIKLAASPLHSRPRCTLRMQSIMTDMVLVADASDRDGTLSE